MKREMTQKDYIVYRLKEANGAWVKASVFIRNYITAYSQRISELRRAGVDIESTGRGSMASYRIRVDE